MNLDILELEGDEVLWRLDGMDGVSSIVEGKVFDTHLCGGPFDMKPDVMRDVANAVQVWLIDRPER